MQCGVAEIAKLFGVKKKPVTLMSVDFVNIMLLVTVARPI